MRIDEREQRLLAACVGISALLHGAALALAPLTRPARGFEPPRVLEVVLPPTATSEPEVRTRVEVPPVAASAPRRRPGAMATAPLAPAPAPDPGPVPEKPASPALPTEAPAPATPAEPAASAAAPPAVEISSPPDFRAAYLRNPPPAYPASARRKREEGTVTLRVLVNDTGQPAQVELERSSGSPALDLAALESVRQWRFAPARRGGAPHPAWVLVPIVFRLEPGA